MGRRSWRVSVIDNGEANFDAAYQAAQRVEDKLVPRYELIA